MLSFPAPPHRRTSLERIESATASPSSGDASPKPVDAGDECAGVCDDLDFGYLEVDDDAADGDGRDAALRDLGSWIGTHAALEDTLDLLRDEGWMA